MLVEKKRLDELRHPDKNVRIHSEQQIRELKRSLSRFGQTRALVVDENNIILIGNGLYDAMLDLGYTEADVYVKTGLSENDKKKLMIADNRTYSLGIDNLDAYRLSAIRTAPFYGCWLGASLLTTEQGIAINDKGQALDTNNQPMAGLYITGDMSGSFFANNYPCLMAGVAMGRTLTFAMKAIKQMAGLE